MCTGDVLGQAAWLRAEARRARNLVCGARKRTSRSLGDHTRNAIKLNKAKLNKPTTTPPQQNPTFEPLSPRSKQYTHRTRVFRPSVAQSCSNGRACLSIDGLAAPRRRRTRASPSPKRLLGAPWPGVRAPAARPRPQWRLCVQQYTVLFLRNRQTLLSSP